jgi:hypothetical protein
MPLRRVTFDMYIAKVVWVTRMQRVYMTLIHKILYIFSTLSQSQQEDFKFVNNYMGSSLVMMSAN